MKNRIVKIEYIPKDDRNNLKNTTPVEEQINEINLCYSEAMSNLHDYLPSIMKHLDALLDVDWNSHWLALGETILAFRIGDDLEKDHYELNPVTGEIIGQADEDEL